MKGKIAYRFETPAYPGNTLYVNIVPKYTCNNDCRFCTRPRTKKDIGKPNIYEKKSQSFLYLPREPSVQEIMKSIEREIKNSDNEIAIIGLGEPLIYLDKVIELIEQIKKKYKVRVRIDTNGLVKCIFDNPTQRLEKAGLDEIRISVNAINEQDYNALCRPKYSNAFSKLLEFVRECNNSRIETYISFVVGYKDDKIKSRTEKEYIDFGVCLGIKSDNIILRKYVKPVG